MILDALKSNDEQILTLEAENSCLTEEVTHFRIKVWILLLVQLPIHLHHLFLGENTISRGYQ